MLAYRDIKGKLLRSVLTNYVTYGRLDTKRKFGLTDLVISHVIYHHKDEVRAIENQTLPDDDSDEDIVPIFVTKNDSYIEPHDPIAWKARSNESMARLLKRAQ